MYPDPNGQYEGCVTSLAVYRGALVAAGEFSHAGPWEARNVAVWDGTRWHALGGGIGGGVSSLAVQGSDLFATGWFADDWDLPRRSVVRWNGLRWKAIDTGLPSNF